MPDLTPALLAPEVACFNCFGSNGPGQLVRLAILTQAVTALDPMADISPQALLTAGKCYACYGLSTGEIMEIGLLTLLVNAIGGISGGTSVYMGTTAQRNATTPPGTAAIWILTDSDPQYQFSLWNGSAWI